MVYSDIAKAIDKVPFTKLIKKLKVVGIHSRIIAGIESFLSERTFQVRVGGTYSSVHHA